MNYLFICSANKQRSKTAEDYFTEKHPEHKYRSAGTNIKVCRKEGTTELTEELLEWAGKVYVMEKKHFEQIKKHTGSKHYSKITVLSIPDVYQYYDKALLRILDERIML